VKDSKDSIVPATWSVSGARAILNFVDLVEIDERSEQCRFKVDPNPELTRISLAWLECLRSKTVSNSQLKKTL
jgi:hypothetical protein